MLDQTRTVSIKIPELQKFLSYLSSSSSAQVGKQSLDKKETQIACTMYAYIYVYYVSIDRDSINWAKGRDLSNESPLVPTA